MINIAPQLRRSFRPKQQVTQSIGVPAPVGGLLATSPVYGDQSAMNRSIYSYNMIPGQYGLDVRKGSYAYAENLLDATAVNGEVRTILDYVKPDGTTKKFAATSEGIWDITGGGTGTWTKVYDFTTENADTGYCKFVQYTTTGGTHYLLITDESNGYITYDGTSWAAGSTTGVTAGNLVDITEYRGRIVFVEKDTGNVWYLANLAISGTATQFEMGTRMRHGGHVKQISTWTYDDSAWMDDRFVVIGEGGDVLVWQGDLDVNPTMQGRWYAGRLPKGRRVLSQWGGDMVLIAGDGVIAMSNLVSGASKTDDDAYLTRDIDRMFRSVMEQTRTSYGWSSVLHPEDGIAVFTTPTQTSQEPIQFVLDITSKAWGMFRNLDMLCAFDGPDGLCFGSTDGYVWQYTGTVDDVPNDSSTSNPIEFSILSHYSTLGAPGKWKRCQFIRPIWLGDNVPNYSIQARYDYDLAEDTSPSISVPGDIALWDAAVWDTETWGGTAQSYQFLNGGEGMGRHVAVACIGETTTALSIIGYDVMIEGGGDL